MQSKLENVRTEDLKKKGWGTLDSPARLGGSHEVCDKKMQYTGDVFYIFVTMLDSHSPN